MLRRARLVLPNCPPHIIQRGHNRQVVLPAMMTISLIAINLQGWKSKLGCMAYAFCLMTNHVYLVVGPSDEPENLSLLLKREAGRQTR